jgi:nucleoside phosphorylase
MRRSIALSAALLALLATAPTALAAESGGGPCDRRVLVLSAMPVEIGPLIDAAHVSKVVAVGDRRFYVGTLEGNDVVLALSGIGIVNATAVTRLALKTFRCGSRPGISGVVFSGTSGGQTYIGDVTVPARWTLDGGKTFTRTDPAMLSTAQSVAASGSVKLEQTTPLGDCGCVGAPPDAVPTVTLDHAPQILMGGKGSTSDPFGGRRLFCIPGGGDVFGCRPCKYQGTSSDEVQQFATGVSPFIDPTFFSGYFQAPPATPAGYDADDMESAAVARVAAASGVPFIAFRALSDGKGDPLMLPGFPFQFFVYRQIAADNAGATALAFLKAWSART